MPDSKRFRVNNLRLAEISTVDRPAQSGALCVLIKSSGSEEEVAFSTICKSAVTVAEGGKAVYSREAYEDAMFVRAAELAKHHHTTPEQALAKHHSTDETLRVLAHAAEIAAYNEYAARVNGRAA